MENFQNIRSSWLLLDSYFIEMQWQRWESASSSMRPMPCSRLRLYKAIGMTNISQYYGRKVISLFLIIGMRRRSRSCMSCYFSSCWLSTGSLRGSGRRSRTWHRSRTNSVRRFRWTSRRFTTTFSSISVKFSLRNFNITYPPRSRFLQ